MEPSLRISCQTPVALLGERLDRVLVTLGACPPEESPAWERFSALSRSRIQRLIDEGHVTLSGRKVTRSARVSLGETIEIVLPPPAPLELTPEPMELTVLFEDSDLIVVDKPAGLVVHPGAGHSTGTLVHGLLAHCKDLAGIGGHLRPGIVHRLDRYTSGCLVVAKTDVAHEGLSRQFAERQVQKEYEAFVFGTPQPDRGVIDTLYGRHPTRRKLFSSRVGRGKRAVTSYVVVGSEGGISRVAIRLGTGRTHQIRVHFSDLGCPVVGDSLYGGQGFGAITDPRLRGLAKSLERHALHAARLEFLHPVTGARLELTSRLPPELAALYGAMTPQEP